MSTATITRSAGTLPGPIRPTGRECTFGIDGIIVSKTDLKGRIAYANDVFLRVAKYSEEEILGKPHNITRHPDMPRCVFKFLWDTIQDGREIFAYVVNLAKNGDHYWVFAHVTPTFDEAGRMIGYHSSKRPPSRKAVSAAQSLYASLCSIERMHRNPRDAWKASLPELVGVLEERRMSYDEFVFSL